MCEGSIQCGEPGDDEFKEGYKYIKHNLFNCVRTSRKNIYTPGGHSWGKHPYWGANGTVNEKEEMKKDSSFGWEKDGRGWAPKDEIDVIYEKEGHFTNPANNSNKQICNHTERVKEESSFMGESFDDEADQVAAIKDECDQSRFKLRENNMSVVDTNGLGKGDNYKHGCATCSSVGVAHTSTDGLKGVPVKYLKKDN